MYFLVYCPSLPLEYTLLKCRNLSGSVPRTVHSGYSIFVAYIFLLLKLMLNK